MSTFNIAVRAAVLGAVLVGALGGGARVGGQERTRPRGEQGGAVVKGSLASVDAGKNTVTVTVHTFNRATQEGTDTDKTFPLAKDAKVLQDAAPAKLADLKKGFPVTLRLEGASAASVSVDGGTARGEFRSANTDRNTIMVLAGRNPSPRVYHLLRTTAVAGADGKAAAVGDLAVGANLELTRSVEDENTVVQIRVLPAPAK